MTTARKATHSRSSSSLESMTDASSARANRRTHLYVLRRLQAPHAVAEGVGEVSDTQLVDFKVHARHDCIEARLRQRPCLRAVVVSGCRSRVSECCPRH